MCGILLMLGIFLEQVHPGTSKALKAPVREATKTDDIEEMPRPTPIKLPFFPGCDKKASKQKRACSTSLMYQYLYANTGYPAGKPQHRTAGIVIVDFLVDKNGKMKDIRLIRDPGHDRGQDALRLFRKMQKRGFLWEPGMAGGEPINVRMQVRLHYNMVWAGAPQQ
ncbi:MAG: energy transducer TonB [Bacteroidota bacterium]